MSYMVVNAKVKFAPKVGRASTGDEYVLLNATKREGRDAAGNAVFVEYHLAVWGQFDVELAKNLSAGDRITFGVEKIRPNVRIDEKTGKYYPYISGNVCSGELSAVYSNTPSPSLFAYEQSQQARREEAKRQREAAQNNTPTPQAYPQQTMATNGLLQPVTANQFATPAPVAPTAPIAPAAPAPVAPAPVAPTVQAPVPPTAPAAPMPPTAPDVALPPTAPAAPNGEIKRDIPF